MGSKAKIWLPLYVGDYLSDTMHLTTTEHGAYLLLLMHQWRQGHIQPDQVRSITKSEGMANDAWSNALARLMHMLSTDENGLVYSARLDKEKEEWRAKQEKAVNKARNAANTRHNRKREELAKVAWSKQQALLKQSPSSAHEVLETCPSPSPLSTNTPPSGSPPPASDRQEATAKQPEAKPEHPPDASQNGPRRSREGGKVGVGMELEAARARTERALGAPAHPMLGKNGKNAVDAREASFRAELKQWWAEINRVSIDKCPWGRPGDRALRGLLQATPMEISDLRTCLEHRWMSVQAGEFAPSILPSRWMREIPSFLSGPVNRYMDPLSHGGGKNV